MDEDDCSGKILVLTFYFYFFAMVIFTKVLFLLILYSLISNNFTHHNIAIILIFGVGVEESYLR